LGEPATPIIHDVDAFLAWENDQEERFEYVGHAIRSMAGGSANHDLIGINVAGTLRDLLRGGPCRAHGSNLKIRSPAGAVMYPDAFVRCGPMHGAWTVIEDPVLVVEVLSPSTEQRDLSQKRWAYQAISSLKALLVVSPDRAAVELFTPEPDGSWRSRLYEGLEARVPIPALDLELSVAELYEGADLGEALA